MTQSCHRHARAFALIRLCFGALLVSCLLTSCSSFRMEMGAPLPPSPPQFAEGSTRVHAVLRELGPPHEVSRLPAGFVFLYQYSLIKEFQLGVSANKDVFRWLKFIKAWNHLDQQALVLRFDDQGVLRAAGQAVWQESLGGGSAVQLLYSVISLSDISELLHPADAHNWGQHLLQPPPVVLNSRQSLRSGENGLQQRVATDYVGQETLEMAKPKTNKQIKRLKKDYQMPQQP